jgi:hypothetical protein
VKVSKRLAVAAAGVLLALGTGMAVPKAAIARNPSPAFDAGETVRPLSRAR